MHATEAGTEAAQQDNARMLAYYQQRAAYYERVYHKPHRQAELRQLEAWLPTQFSGRSVLEVAAGTGWWTPHGARDASRWLATDANPDTLAVARCKPLPASVELRVADAYSWAELGDESFDGAFAGCWWSHVPLQRLAAWVDSLHARLRPGARVVVLDNHYVEGDSTPVTRFDAFGNGYQTRTLDDGSTHEVLKNFPTPEQAFAVLGPRAAQPEWIQHPHYWVLTYRLN
ncbi:MAG: class I SAM-dependent methyltransferase [Betaproteobacteria bacterium]|jgi:demethylmenaquinone methyltransferase/2-methoxy-6-polyprenyl-1,4-benzoquinol methylase